MATKATPTTESKFSPSELTERMVHRRAVEAVIWGMPAVNFDRMLRAAIDNGGNANQMIYWSQPVNSKNQTLTPNPDTIYLNPFYDIAAMEAINWGMAAVNFGMMFQSFVRDAKGA